MCKLVLFGFENYFTIFVNEFSDWGIEERVLPLNFAQFPY